MLTWTSLLSCWTLATGLSLARLNYLAQTTRPDIVNATHQLAKYSSNPREPHGEVILYLVCYLKKTRDLGMLFKPNGDKGLECYCDADFSGNWNKYLTPYDPSTAKSHSGWIVFYARCKVIWASKLQTQVMLSTTKAEYIAMSQSWCKPLTNIPYNCTFWHARLRSDARLVIEPDCRVSFEEADTSDTPTWRSHHLNLVGYLEQVKISPEESVQWHEITWIGINYVPNPTPILYVDSSTGCGFFSSWPCVPTPNVRSNIWERIESYAIHMILACRLRIISKSHKIHFGSTTQPVFPSLDSHFSQVIVSTLLFLFSLCCISGLGRKAYGTIDWF